MRLPSHITVFTSPFCVPILITTKQGMPPPGSLGQNLVPRTKSNESSFARFKFEPKYQSKVRLVHSWKLPAKKRHRQVLVLQVSIYNDYIKVNFGVVLQFQIHIFSAVSAPGAVTPPSWAPTCKICCTLTICDL